MQYHPLSRLSRWAALMALLAVGVLSIQSAPLNAQDPPENNEATGTPTLIGPLQVGGILRVDTSSIADADGLTNPGFSYTWLADDDLAEPGAFLRALSFVNEYEVAPYDVGLTIKVQVHFEDDGGNRESLDVQATSTVAAVAPDSPPDLSASLGDPGELVLSWSTPAVCDFTLVFDCWLDTDRTFSVGDGGSDITGYTVQWKLASRSWSVASDVSKADVTTTSYTVTGLSVSNTYTVRVLARNAVGAGAPSTEVTVSSTDLNLGPVVSGRAVPSFFETNPRDVATYTATDPENDTITWSLSGPDASFFSIASGVLNFDSAGDYEDPRDAGRNNAYNLNVHASDGRNTVRFPVTVVINDVDEAPVVTGPSSVSVRSGSTAHVALYRAMDAEGFVTSWEPLSGTDAQHFEFSDTGELRFTAVPDSATPADDDGDNRYEVTVGASSDGRRGIRTGTLDVVVTVTAPPRRTGGGGGGGGGFGGPILNVTAVVAGEDAPTGLTFGFAYTCANALGQPVVSRTFTRAAGRTYGTVVAAGLSCSLTVSDDGGATAVDGLFTDVVIPPAGYKTTVTFTFGPVPTDVPLDAETVVEEGAVSLTIPEGSRDAPYSVLLETGREHCEAALDADGESLSCSSVTVFDSDGEEESGVTLLVPATITITLDPARVDELGGIEGVRTARERGELRMLRRDDADSPWREIPFTVDETDDGAVQIVLSVSTFSDFALIASEARLQVLPLYAGWTVVVWGGADGASIAEALGDVADHVDVIYQWVADTQTWRSHRPADPPILSAFDSFTRGATYWVRSSEAVEWTIVAGPLEPPAAGPVRLHDRWTEVIWDGPDGAPIAEALGDILDQVEVVYQWLGETQSWRSYRPAAPAAPAALSAFDTFQTGGSYWIAVTEAVEWTVAEGGPTATR